MLLNLQDDHESTAVGVLFPLKGESSSSQEPLYMLAWTTTPWSLTGNEALAINREEDYVSVEIESIPGRVVFMKNRSQFVSQNVPFAMKSEREISTDSLLKMRAEHPYEDRTVPILHSPWVTSDAGTGVVHTAPAHGDDDYKLSLSHSLPLTCHVGLDGKYLSTSPKDLVGLNVLQEGTEISLKILKSQNKILWTQKYLHKYPYDWRTNKPVITLSTKQWFLELSELKSQVFSIGSSYKMTPSSSRNRLDSFIDSRETWCLSRQRSWGVPLPIFYHKNNRDNVLIDHEIIEHVADLVERDPLGTDVWWRESVDKLLPERYRHLSLSLEKGSDTLDVWFDSGCSFLSLSRDPLRSSLSLPPISDLVVEGSDQHRGWFQSSLLLSVSYLSLSPFSHLSSHGFVLDGKNQKMSKSQGNVIDPSSLSLKTGIDPMRMAVIMADYTRDISLGEEQVEKAGEIVRKVRNLCRFALGNVGDLDVKDMREALKNHKNLPEVDR